MCGALISWPPMKPQSSRPRSWEGRSSPSDSTSVQFSTSFLQDEVGAESGSRRRSMTRFERKQTPQGDVEQPQPGSLAPDFGPLFRANILAEPDVEEAATTSELEE